MKTLALTILCACASSKPAPTAPPKQTEPAGQSLTAAAAMLCASPTRAEHDPEFAGAEPADRAAGIAKHAKDGITNARVLALIDGWSSEDKSSAQKLTELDKLTNDAGLSSKCALREAWAPPTP
jgi:hypothetical protein